VGEALPLSSYGYLSQMPVIDIVRRIDCRLNGRSLLSAHEQMLGDARDEIVRLREEIKVLEKELGIVKEDNKE